MSGKELNMHNRKRFLAICRGQRQGDVSLFDWFHRGWSDTVKEWVKQGAPEEIKTGGGYNRYFGLDHVHSLQDIIAELNRNDLRDDPSVQSMGQWHVTPPVVPVFDIKVLREDERHRVETTYGGVTVEISKKNPWRMPKYIDHPVKDWKSWKEYKKRLDPTTPERWPADWAGFTEKRNKEDSPTLLLLAGFFGVLREWMGLERLLYTFYDDPKLVEDMMDQVLCLGMGVVKWVVKDLRIEFVRFWEDMAYKSGPLISPEMFKKFMLPRYKEILDYLRNHGVDVIQVDSDGNIDELIPIWMDAGLNFFWPMECAANMDAISWRKKYGKEIILSGNIDKRIFARGKEAIRTEVMSKVPYLLETGGYFPALDHVIPPDISLENYRYFINLLREIGGLDKLPE